MTRKLSYTTLGLVMIALLAATAASADGVDLRGDYKRTYKMDTVDRTADYKLFGYLHLARSNGVEMLGLRVFADLPDGSNLIVEVRNKLGQFEVGTIEIFLGSGSFRMYSSFAPSPAFPLDGLQAIEVRDARGRLLLQKAL